MARKKDLVPNVERCVVFVCENPFEFGKSGDWLKYRPRGRLVDAVNGQLVPPLVDGWQSKVSAIAPSLTARHLAEIEMLSKRYVSERVARQLAPVEWKDHIAWFRRVAVACKALLKELNDERGERPRWDRLEQISKIGGLAPIEHRDVNFFVSRLYSSAEAAIIQAGSDHKITGSLSHREPWGDLVTALADICSQVGIAPKVAKSVRASYAKPSLFAQLVWKVMKEAVPPSLREHDASQGAMQAAISNALRPTRRDHSRKKRR